MNQRKAYVQVNEDMSITLLKPYSDYYTGKLIVVHEDAHGHFDTRMMSYKEIYEEYGLMKVQLDKLEWK